MVTIRVSGVNLENIELVVFDKDGTLIDLYRYWSRMIEFRAEKICDYYGLETALHKNKLMHKMGVDLSRGILKPEGPVGILPREVVRKAAENYLDECGHAGTSQVCIKIFNDVDEESEMLLDELVVPIEGASELLEGLKNKECKLAIATTDKTYRAELALKYLKWDGLIDIVIGADKVTNSKPDPEMLERICADLGVEPDRSIMIGDAKTDVQMGINAGFNASIAVTSGLTPEYELRGITSHIVRDVSEIQLIQ